MIEVHQLLLFRAIYEEGSISGGALRQEVAQPVMSLNLAKMEKVLNTKLFRRKARGVEPTEAGRLLYYYSEKILSDIEGLTREMNRLSGENEATLSIGMSPHMAEAILYSVVTEFNERFPNTELNITQSASVNLHRMLLSGLLDMAALAFLPHAGQFQVKRIYADEGVIIAARDNVLKNHQRYPLSKFSPLNLIVQSKRHNTRQLIDRAISASGAKVDRLLEVDGLAGILDLVGAGDWVALVPFPVAWRHRDSVNIYSLRDPPLIEYYITYPTAKPPTSVGRAMIEIISRHCQQLSRESKKLLK